MAMEINDFTPDVLQAFIGSNGVVLYRVTALEESCDVKAFFSSRIGGVSTGNFHSLNVGRTSMDLQAAVKENRDRVRVAAGLQQMAVVSLKQIHSDHIACISEKEWIEFGLHQPEAVLELSDYDAVITDCSKLLLTTYHADCLPVFFSDPENGVIALAHAGWRGTMLNIAAKTAEKMVNEFHAKIDSITAVIGPGICADCFEVGPEVVEAIEKESRFPLDPFIRKGSGDRFYLDLKAINQRQLENLGIHDIKKTAHCTCCESETFFSHRRDKECGRMSAGICKTGDREQEGSN